MRDELVSLRATLERIVGRLRPETLHPKDASRLLSEFARLKNLAAAGETLAARRVAETNAWMERGDRSPAHFLARKAGTSVSQANRLIDTASRMKDLPKTEDAFRKGELSIAQAQEIASAAAADPSSEAELLEVAKKRGLSGLREACQRVKASSSPDEVARYRAIYEQRYLRSYTDSEGAFRLDAKMTPEQGASFVSCLEPYKNDVFTEARKQGRNTGDDDDARPPPGADAQLELSLN